MADDNPTRHKGARNDLSAEFVRSILDYDPETGVMRWKVSMPPRGRVGAIAGFLRKSGHIAIGIHGGEYYAHRLAYLIVKGEWPPYEIDHEDNDHGNNRWLNLRPATSSQNLCNKPSHNPHGYRGVSKANNKWMAKITVDGKQIYLGVFLTREEAHTAYCEATQKYHGAFAHTGSISAVLVI